LLFVNGIEPDIESKRNYFFGLSPNCKSLQSLVILASLSLRVAKILEPDIIWGFGFFTSTVFIKFLRVPVLLPDVFGLWIIEGCDCLSSRITNSSSIRIGLESKFFLANGTPDFTLCLVSKFGLKILLLTLFIEKVLIEYCFENISCLAESPVNSVRNFSVSS
jgi:hypothetical protein